MTKYFEKMDSKIIGDRLRTLRGDKSIAEIAKALDLSPSTWSMYENGERIPRDDIKLQIADYFHRPIHLIFFVDRTHKS